MASGSFTSVNLSQLPAPAVIEVLDFEAMFDESLTALQALDPTFDALLPSDPAFKILEVCTYLRLLDRQRVNDAARGVMLAYAVGSDLDQLAAIFGITRLVLDPGFGFGKRTVHNFTLLRELARFTEAGLPVLAGMSRKSMIGAVTGREVGERLAGSVAAALIAVQRGAGIVRVHDVAATVDAIKVWQAMRPHIGDD